MVDRLIPTDQLTFEDKRAIWLPEHETETVTEMGQSWPTAIIVNLWERNLIGERRYVSTRMYVPQGEELRRG